MLCSPFQEKSRDSPQITDSSAFVNTFTSFCVWKSHLDSKNIFHDFWWESLMRAHGLIHWSGFLTSFHTRIPAAVWQVIWGEGWDLVILLSSEFPLVYFPKFILIKQKQVFLSEFLSPDLQSSPLWQRACLAAASDPRQGCWKHNCPWLTQSSRPFLSEIPF